MAKQPENPRRALGRGLSALFPPKPLAETPAEAFVPATPAAMHVPIDLIDPNPLQPRTVFQPDKLAELAQSIRANGIIQPLILRRAGERYELVAGERRWRAARLAEMESAPAIVQDYADDRLLEVTLIENIQREDLNPIEVAHALERLGKEHNLTHEEIGRRTGKDRATITNLLRLLRLPIDIQLLLAEHRLSTGHAKVILGLPTPELQSQVAAKASSQGFSVRQLERYVRRVTEPREEKPAEPRKVDPNLKAALQELERTLGTRVRIVQKSDKRGTIEIDYFSLEELDRLYALLVGTE